MEHTQTALIVIDMQADYIGEKSPYHYYPNELIDKINERIDVAVKQDELVIYVQNIGRRKKEQYVSEFVEGLSIVSDFIVRKEKSSIFDNSSLVDTLKLNRISHIELIGIDGNCCVALSAIEASKRGFAVTFPLDYIGIKDKERFCRTKVKLIKANVEIVEIQEKSCLKQANFQG